MGPRSNAAAERVALGVLVDGTPGALMLIILGSNQVGATLTVPAATVPYPLLGNFQVLHRYYVDN
jgi:hypothetical protein